MKIQYIMNKVQELGTRILQSLKNAAHEVWTHKTSLTHHFLLKSLY